MTTFDPGANDVFTHGLTSSPRSTAFFASNPAASITYGFEVFVHDVIAAMTTWPWSRVTASPPPTDVSFTGTEALGRSAARGVDSVDAVGSGSPFASMPSAEATGSEAGKVWAAASSCVADSTDG